MNPTEMQHTLEELRSDFASGMTMHPNKRWGSMHALAEARYEPALEWFVSLLDHPRWSVREEAISMIGFHYIFPSNGDIVRKIQTMLLSDPYDTVRLSAAGVLGVCSTWPDRALETAMQSDSEDDVRQVAFESLLKLAGLPRHDISTVNKHLESGALDTSLPCLHDVLRTYNKIPEESPDEASASDTT